MGREQEWSGGGRLVLDIVNRLFEGFALGRLVDGFGLGNLGQRRSCRTHIELARHHIGDEARAELAEEGDFPSDRAMRRFMFECRFLNLQG